MNEQDRTTRDALVKELQAIHSKVETLRDDEQSKYDNLSDGLQNAESGQQIEQNAGALTEALDSIDEAVRQMEDCN